MRTIDITVDQVSMGKGSTLISVPLCDDALISEVIASILYYCSSKATTDQYWVIEDPDQSRVFGNVYVDSWGVCSYSLLADEHTSVADLGFRRLYAQAKSLEISFSIAQNFNWALYRRAVAHPEDEKTQNTVRKLTAYYAPQRDFVTFSAQLAILRPDINLFPGRLYEIPQYEDTYRVEWLLPDGRIIEEQIDNAFGQYGSSPILNRAIGIDDAYYAPLGAAPSAVHRREIERITGSVLPDQSPLTVTRIVTIDRDNVCMGDDVMGHAWSVGFAENARVVELLAAVSAWIPCVAGGFDVGGE